jgi:RNase adapter protein RapZ
MTLEAVLITGMSGSGKSVALRALEDAGYYCVDNLPPELLLSFVELEQQNNAQRVAIAMDVRSATSLPLVPAQLKELRSKGVIVRPLFLDATTDTLVRRFSETRRRHPLSSSRAAAEGDEAGTDRQHALVDAIELERELLSDLREQAHVIDTSVIRPSQLQAHVKSLLSAPVSQLTLVFESFAFKRGIPVDADYVFDVRMLPNPHYEAALRDQTGRDQEVVDFLEQQPEVAQMYSQIHSFLAHWLGPLARDHRSYVTVAIGCTGGQHRSVYLVEKLSKAFGEEWITLKRHRELDVD